MANITLTYNRFYKWGAVEIETTHPTSWQELTAPQMRAVSALLAGKMSEDKMLAIMLNVKKKVVKRLSKWQRFNLGELLNFLKKTVPCNKFIADEINGFYAPKTALKGVTFQEFIMMDTYFMDYIETNSEEALNKFVAVIYRPKKRKLRETFSEERIPINAQIVKSWERIEKETIVLNYTMIRQWLSVAYPFVFPSNADDEETDETKQPKAKATGGWIEIFDSLIGDELTKTTDYATLPIHQVLRYLNRKIKENLKSSK